jgi:hypothetical protein
MGNLETVQHIYQAFAMGDIQTMIQRTGRRMDDLP